MIYGPIKISGSDTSNNEFLSKELDWPCCTSIPWLIHLTKKFKHILTWLSSLVLDIDINWSGENLLFISLESLGIWLGKFRWSRKSLFITSIGTVLSNSGQIQYLYAKLSCCHCLKCILNLSLPQEPPLCCSGDHFGTHVELRLRTVFPVRSESCRVFTTSECKLNSSLCLTQVSPNCS